MDPRSGHRGVVERVLTCRLANLVGAGFPFRSVVPPIAPVGTGPSQGELDYPWGSIGRHVVQSPTYTADNTMILVVSTFEPLSPWGRRMLSVTMVGVAACFLSRRSSCQHVALPDHLGECDVRTRRAERHDGRVDRSFGFDFTASVLYGHRCQGCGAPKRTRLGGQLRRAHTCDTVAATSVASVHWRHERFCADADMDTVCAVAGSQQNPSFSRVGLFGLGSGRASSPPIGCAETDPATALWDHLGDWGLLRHRTALATKGQPTW